MRPTLLSSVRLSLTSPFSERVESTLRDRIKAPYVDVYFSSSALFLSPMWWIRDDLDRSPPKLGVHNGK